MNLGEGEDWAWERGRIEPGGWGGLSLGDGED
jgi:hypothetical protein